jgi:anaerobic selenocysteine-containing dehydrogenase/Fe-S-cluster-containing dehydrogenase component
MTVTDGIKRRDFLKVLGVTGAGATMTGCGTGEVEKLLPYVVAPEEITPGVATWYATTCGGCSAGCGMWVRTREGRAVKVEGNPNHPISKGGLCARGHATLQHLYNPDRFAGPMIREGDRFRQGTWDEAERLLAARIQGARTAGQQVMFVGGHTGPTMSRLVDAFLSAVGSGTRVEYDAVSDAPLREATRLAYGVDQLPTYDIAAAHLLLSFGNDFIEHGSSPVAHNKGLAQMSSVDAAGHEKGTFVYLGPRLSTTGLNADEWLPIRPGSEATVALGMASYLAGADAPPAYANLLQGYDLARAAAASGIGEDTLRELAERFRDAGPSLAMGPGAGAHHRNATAANLAVLILNEVAGNVGRTVMVGDGQNAASSPFSSMADAIAMMAGGGVGVALVHGTNPAYSLPAGSGFAAAFDQVPFKVSFASAMDETAAMADLIMPDRHFLEAWGDAHPRRGVHSVQQPVMQAVPHFDSKQSGDALIAVARHLGTDMGAATFYEYFRAPHQAMHADDPAAFERMWHEHLRTGMFGMGGMAMGGMGMGMAAGAGMGPAGDAVQLRAPDVALTFDVPAFDGSGDLTLIVHPSPRFGGGEFSNSPWMQELPDPVSKITWHSWLEMNPATAEARGIREGDIVTVTSPHGSVEVPVWIYPGIREDAVALAMGGGHTEMGRWATGSGVNAMQLLPAAAEQPSGAFVTLATTVSVAPTGQRRRIATIEGSNQQYDRPIAPAVALAALGHAGEEHEEGAHHEPLQELQGYGGVQPVPAEEGAPTAYPLAGADHGLYADAHEKPRWGMAIDLDKCTGCSACVTACHAENNVPWVGEQQVVMGRDMSWVRIERYYEHIDATHASHLDVRFLPMICQHCGNAPCEPVCPVYATYHTPEGVNAQVYNRCVGTRYCANNCPYKVRVYNWYRYADENVPEPMTWQWNPDVTVRTNGIMEKCSFCMQRIRDAENRAALEEGREVRDGEIVPACQQSCPAEAIVFGNLRDPESRVSQVVANERTYRVLDELINTQPAVNYLKKVTFHEVSGGH